MAILNRILNNAVPVLRRFPSVEALLDKTAGFCEEALHYRDNLFKVLAESNGKLDACKGMLDLCKGQTDARGREEAVSEDILWAGQSQGDMAAVEQEIAAYREWREATHNVESIIDALNEAGVQAVRIDFSLDPKTAEMLVGYQFVPEEATKKMNALQKSLGEPALARLATESLFAESQLVMRGGKGYQAHSRHQLVQGADARPMPAEAAQVMTGLGALQSRLRHENIQCHVQQHDHQAAKQELAAKAAAPKEAAVAPESKAEPTASTAKESSQSSSTKG